MHPSVLAIFEDDYVAFHHLPQTPPLFSPKAEGGDLSDTQCCLPFELLTVRSRSLSLDRKRKGVEECEHESPSNAWCCPFVL